MIRLAQTTADRLPPAVVRPGYDRAALAIGQVHLGLGAFHRAHQAVYTERALAADFGPWGIAGVSLRTRGAMDQVAAQDGLYVVEERSAAQTTQRLIGAIKEAHFAPDDPARIYGLIASRNVKVVTLTITEKGYVAPSPEEALLPGSPAMSAVSWLLSGLVRRRAAGSGPIAILSCDNLPRNSERLRALLLAAAERHDATLLPWIDANVATPCTVVDRIVPAPSAAELDAFAASSGVRDEGFLATESFSQWIIEDKFLADRPAWERAGATFVANTAPYEKLKLRLLNASHSTLAYLGCLLGLETLDQVIAVPAYRALVTTLMTDEAIPSCGAIPGLDVLAYRDALLARFASSAIRHRTQQIAQDGAMKIPVRLLPTVEECLKSPGAPPPEAAALGIALWVRFAGLSDPAAILRTMGATPASLALIQSLSRVLQDVGPDAAVAHVLHNAAVRRVGNPFQAVPGVSTANDSRHPTNP